MSDLIKTPAAARLQSILWWLFVVGAPLVAWKQYGLPGLATALGAVLFWLLLQFTRVMTVMKTAARRPKGYVRDAANLHRRMRLGVKLFDLVRATGGLGVLVSAEGQQPEVYHWTDSGGVRLTCTFDNGRLVAYELGRGETPEPEPETPPAQP